MSIYKSLKVTRPFPFQREKKQDVTERDEMHDYDKSGAKIEVFVKLSVLF